MVSLPAAEILSKSVAAANAAKSFRIAGAGEAFGLQSTLDLISSKEGTASGTITFGGKLELIQVPGFYDVKGDAGYWSKFGGSFEGQSVVELKDSTDSLFVAATGEP